MALNVRNANLVAVVILSITTAFAEPKIEDVSVTEFQALVAQSNGIILDVRTPAEYQVSHIPDAMNVSVQADDFDSMLAALDPRQTYIVHCTKNPADGRSSRALERMQQLGFRNLYSLEGGYIAWKESELPLVETDADDGGE